MEETNKKSKLPIISLICIALAIVIIIILFFLRPKTKDVTITFDSKGGTPVEDIIVKEGSVIRLPETEKTGYEFAGWYWEDIKLEKEIKVKEDRDLIAKWVLKQEPVTEPILFEITFNTDGGNSLEKVKAKCGEPFKLPTPPEKNRYIFRGWKDQYGRVVVEGALLSCDDQVLTATWEKKIEYYCPEGYSLSGSKCKTTMVPDKHCREDEIDIGNEMCISDYKKEDKCGSKVVEYRDGSVEKTEGIYIPALNSCFYGEEDSYEEETCNRTFGEDHYQNNTCYVEKDTIKNICPGEHIYFTEEQLKRKTNLDNVKEGCYKLLGFSNFCENDYQLENDTCVKTINASVRQ